MDDATQRRRRLTARRRILGDEDTDVKQLPPDVVGSREFQGASLALRLVHQLLRPAGRRAPLVLASPPAEALRAALAGQGVPVRDEEAKALVEEALRTGLWELEGAEGAVAIYAAPPSLLAHDD